MDIHGKRIGKTGDEKELRDYHCLICNYKFQQYVRKAGKQGIEKHGNVSSQVRCCKCGNFLKTWD